MQIAEDHWSYIEKLLEAHNEPEISLEKIKFHYISAFIHGYKHGVESVLDKSTDNRVKKAEDWIKDILEAPLHKERREPYNPHTHIYGPVGVPWPPEAS